VKTLPELVENRGTSMQLFWITDNGVNVHRFFKLEVATHTLEWVGAESS